MASISPPSSSSSLDAMIQQLSRDHPIETTPPSPSEEADHKEDIDPDLDPIVTRLRTQIAPPFPRDVSSETILRILQIEPERLKKIVHLNLSGLGLTRIPELFNTLSFPALKTISFANNNISTLPDPLLPKCPILEEIDLQGNMISILPEELCSYWSQIKEIHLESNQLTELPTKFGISSQHHAPKVTLSLNGNQIATLAEATLQNIKAALPIQISLVDFK